jgi:hypothetical protein
MLAPSAELKATVESRPGTKPLYPAEIGRANWNSTRNLEARKALYRIWALAKDKNMLVKNPPIYLEANKYVYEVEFGRPKISLDKRTTVDVQAHVAGLEDALKAIKGGGLQKQLTEYAGDVIDAQVEDLEDITESSLEAPNIDVAQSDEVG